MSERARRHPGSPIPEAAAPPMDEYRRLMRERSRMGAARFEFVYNQADTGGDSGMVRREWIDRHALDRNRSLWDGASRPQIPEGAKLVATLDPSPTKWACAQVWAFRDIPDHESQNEDGNAWEDYLIALRRERMDAPAYLRLMEQWTTALGRWGHYVPWVVEVNAAQRWLLQTDDYKRMRLRTNIRVVPHTTGFNKLDPNYGVQSLGPRYEYGRVSLPWGDPVSRNELAFFVNELCAWPDGSTDDAVMAQWFAHANRRKLMNAGESAPFEDTRKVGAYFERRRKLIAV